MTYEAIIAKALRGCLKSFLTVSHGLFKGTPTTQIYVDLTHKDVVVSEYVKQKFDANIVLVVDGHNIDFHAGDDGFSAKYSINESYEEFYIPYEAILAFSDSSSGLYLDFSGGASEQKDYVEEQPLVEEVQTDAASSSDKVCSLAAWKKAKGKPLTKLEEASLNSL